MRESLLRGPPEGIDISLPDPEEGTTRFDDFLESPAGVRLQGGIMAAGGVWTGYVAFGAILAVEVVTVGTFLTALSLAATPALVVGGLYVLATADGDLLDALDQVNAITDQKGAGKAFGKYILDQTGRSHSDSVADGPKAAPAIEFRDPVSQPNEDTNQVPAPGSIGQDDFSPPQVGRPDPIQIDRPPGPKETTPGPMMGGEFGGWHSGGDGRGPRESSDDGAGSGDAGFHDTGSSGADTSSDNPCDKLGGAKPETCD